MLTPPSNETFVALATPQERLDAVIAHLTEGPLDDGGYPYDYEWFGSTLVVAELDDNGSTTVGIYKRRDLLALYRLAARFLRENEGEDYDVEKADQISAGLHRLQILSVDRVLGTWRPGPSSFLRSQPARPHLV